MLQRLVLIIATIVLIIAIILHILILSDLIYVLIFIFVYPCFARSDSWKVWGVIVLGSAIRRGVRWQTRTAADVSRHVLDESAYMTR